MNNIDNGGTVEKTSDIRPFDRLRVNFRHRTVQV